MRRWSEAARIGGGRVVVVVDLGDVLAGRGTDHPAGALDEQAVVGDRGGEEQGVEGRGVEAFADERRGADDEDAVAGFGVGEPVTAARRSVVDHAALQHERLVSARGEQREFRASTWATRRVSTRQLRPRARAAVDVVDDLCVACLVDGEARCTSASAPGRAQVHSRGAGRRSRGGTAAAVVPRQLARRPASGALLVRRSCGVPDGSELPGDEFAESVTPGRGGGEAEPELRGDAFDRVVVRGGREVVALVDDDVPVAAG